MSMWGAIGQALLGDFGGKIGGSIDADNEANKNRDMQVAFAKNAIQWKVADANKAGIHPLYALGAPTMNFQPVTTGGSGWGDIGSSMGQNIDRALGAGMPREGQVDALDRSVRELALTRGGLENELLAIQIAKAKQDLLMKPAVPDVTLPGGQAQIIPGQSSTAQVVQDHYGDVVEAGYGMGRLVYDTMTAMDKAYGGKFLGPHGVIMNGRPNNYRPSGRKLPYGSYGYAKTGRR